MLKKLVLTLALLSCNNLLAQDSWNLPIELNDTNTQINFEVDSTWVLVEGKTSGIKGQILPANASAKTWRTNLVVPVKNMLTGLGARDSKLQRIMAATDFPEIKVELLGDSTDCNPKAVEENKSCILKQTGSLEIRGVKREVAVNAVVTKEENQFVANGEITFPWAAFGVEDPSILVAKLRPDVRVLYKVFINQ